VQRQSRIEWPSRFQKHYPSLELDALAWINFNRLCLLPKKGDGMPRSRSIHGIASAANVVEGRLAVETCRIAQEEQLVIGFYCARGVSRTQAAPFRLERQNGPITLQPLACRDTDSPTQPYPAIGAVEGTDGRDAAKNAGPRKNAGLRGVKQR
jgi:hypothetical protein